jgi:hypothetical protein
MQESGRRRRVARCSDGECFCSALRFEGKLTLIERPHACTFSAASGWMFTRSVCPSRCSVLGFAGDEMSAREGYEVMLVSARRAAPGDRRSPRSAVAHGLGCFESPGTTSPSPLVGVSSSLPLVRAPVQDDLLVALVPDGGGLPADASTGLDALASRPRSLASGAGPCCARSSPAEQCAQSLDGAAEPRTNTLAAVAREGRKAFPRVRAALEHDLDELDSAEQRSSVGRFWGPGIQWRRAWR